MSLPPQRPPPPPESEKPSEGPGGLRSPAARDAGQESPADTRPEPRLPEQAQGSTHYPSQVGHDGGEESDKNLLESAEGPSGAQGQPSPFEPPTDTTPPPTRSRDGHFRMPRRPTTVLRPAANPSEIDWIVPVDKPHRKTYGERIQPTIDAAEAEKQKAYNRAIMTSYALNIAIGLQVLLGALTTGIAAALQTGKQAQVSTSILGGLSTLVASYLARARGSGEPELSNIRVRELDHFLRDCKAFKLDHAHETNNERVEYQIADFRQRLEVILGGPSGEKKMSPPV
ncbi:hypothetical protein EDD16DRAFT_1618619 [Pisolithus croceorrhizus]|nr:hypothetical protein EDD16DRAFT_1618619 [Pisolithus croceorrhizus]KAI6122961.1 hypothetical protein EV401DRAFT_2069753 [Pisolithus croceorrhizus]